ncbi:MAG: alpha/beta hydrolase, partial [Cyanobacteria bacterium P01_H01_bin.105]
MQLIQGIHLSAVSEVRRHLPLLVFLPGMDGSDLSLRQQSEGLTSVFDVRCLCIPKNDMTDWRGLGTNLIELVTKEKKYQPDRPIYLCGESFGACLALTAIRHCPHLFDRLILINPASSFSRQIWSFLGASVVKWLPSQ